MHRWLDLSAFAGQTITVALAYPPGAPGQPLTVDEVSIGDAEMVPVSRVYLPLIA
jgi:hypothetical protein